MPKGKRQIQKPFQMKPEYHQSFLKNYLKCPQMFRLSTEIKTDVQTMAMREGQLFEGYVFGFKPNKDEKILIGKKKTETVDLIKIHATKTKPLFKTGDSYVKLYKEFDEYILGGEADHIGQLDWDYIKTFYPEAKSEGDTINDIKYTGSLDNGLFTQNGFIDNFQALMYAGLHYFITGDLLPFIYVIVEGEYLEPIIRINKVFIQISDIENKLIPYIDMVHNDLFYQAKVGFDTCLGGKKGSRCWFLEHCKEGRKFVGGYNLTEFGLINYQ